LTSPIVSEPKFSDTNLFIHTAVKFLDYNDL